ncbi:MAG: 3-deoxy-manno-octulosonate cytidylyltransferase [Alphaproteobacteria bacterium]|nr:3-deoxy-manno-octulosonate cytidylyltransferase [Alphaproteobacteria bacterium]
MKTLIVIPARFGSTRLPGKPLLQIAGKTLLQHMIAIAKNAAQNDPDVSLLVATDDERIITHAKECEIAAVLTPETCATGTDRVREAVRISRSEADFILNLQGDTPFTPPDFLDAMIQSFKLSPCDVVTPVTQLTWDQLDKLRETKETTPFSGTTAVFNKTTGLAHWFSKNIIPAIRKEDTLRDTTTLSPVWRHIGLYGYSRTMLDAFVTLSEGHFEALEGLEQLRVIEHGYKIRCVPVDYRGRPSMTGIDSPEDVVRAEALL